MEFDREGPQVALVIELLGRTIIYQQGYMDAREVANSVNEGKMTLDAALIAAAVELQ
jgi:hypothetical protein